ncbi:hypothetical protein BC938DRAFT_476178 [Jimgerdemannia flammicorona]|uniref:Uncharacterized protein n=1 Tax=Jimgerdemannia flammicorona TaxID=994334 RepID=A0A433PJU0_9FUNG|nr:hypothetical protein BC938DRAFT_476178 [Jimgerdemannia flammicorona]
MADQPQLHEHTPLLADPESTVDPPPPQAPWNWRRTLALAVFYALIAVFIFYSLSYFIADELVRYPPALATTISPYPTKFSIKWEHAVTLSPVRNYVTYTDDRDTGTKQPISTLSVIRRGGWFISGKSFWLQLQEKQNALPLSPEHLDPDKPAVYQVGDVRTGFSWWQVFFSDVPSALYITFHHDDATVDPLLRCEYRIDFYKLARRCPGEKSFQPVAHIYDGLWNLEEIYIGAGDKGTLPEGRGGDSFGT